MAAYFIAQSAASGGQLYKLGFDESVTKWTDPGFNLAPNDLTFFNNAVWFSGETPANGLQQAGKRWQRDEVDRHRDRLIPARLDGYQQCITVQRLSQHQRPRPAVQAGS